MRLTAAIVSIAVLLGGTSLALAQGAGGGGAGGSAGSAGAAGSPGTSGSTTGSSVPSGTGPAPSPTPGQSFTPQSNAGTPGTGTANSRIPSGTSPAPFPTPGQSTTPGTTGQGPSLGTVPGLNSAPSSGQPNSGTVGQSSGQPQARAGCPNGGASGPAGSAFGTPVIIRDPTFGSNRTGQSTAPSLSPPGSASGC